MKGSYALLIKLENDKHIQIGKLGNIFFKRGFYIYVGSAINGLEQRINRHLRKDKKIHWHIDYLSKNAKIAGVYYKESNQRNECKIAKSFLKFKSVNGFGCSDCKCDSHLFYGPKNELIKSVNSLNMKNYC